MKKRKAVTPKRHKKAAPKHRKPIIKKVVLKKGHVAVVKVPKGHTPSVVHHSHDIIEVAPAPVAQSWWSKMIWGDEE